MRLKVPYFRQETNVFCGPACIQMVMRHFGKSYPSQSALARAMKTDLYGDKGTSHGNMIGYFRAKGFIARSMYFATLEDIERLMEEGIPCIVHFTEPSEEDDHYAIVSEITPTKVVLNDPWNGNNFTFSREEFLKRWADKKGKEHPHWMLVARPK